MIYLHVGAIEQCVQVGQTNWSLVLEPGQQSLLDGPELLSMTTQPLTTVQHVDSKLREK